MSCASNARVAARSVLVVGLFASLFIALTIDTTLAQGPFGMGAAAPHPPGGVAGWVLAKQAQYYRGLGTMIRTAKADGSAAVGLHAAPPGFLVGPAAWKIPYAKDKPKAPRDLPCGLLVSAPATRRWPCGAWNVPLPPQCWASACCC
jgi:hypothetical protein